MIFDQYSRYKACADLLRQSGFISGDSVLDIGSGPECLFGQFMPDASMFYVDPLIPSHSGAGYVTGNVFASELDEQRYDCITAVDVLEHVPPDLRSAFLVRFASLGKKTLLLGFPTSDSSDAISTDNLIGDKYRVIFGREYSWLEEHYRYGLPSLTDTIEQLNKLGWNCQVIGHGHAPWLQEFLSFVVCVWELPSMKKLILKSSETFNTELYPYDFLPPYYRQFIVATRCHIPLLIAPGNTNDFGEANNIFRELMEQLKQAFFNTAVQELNKKNATTNERDMAYIERDNAYAERDNAYAERDNAYAERDNAYLWRDKIIEHRDELLIELNSIWNSNAWKLVRLWRGIRRTLKHGRLRNRDRQRLKEVFFNIFHKK